VHHYNFSRLWPSLRLRLEAGRLFGGMRGRAWPVGRRFLYAAGAPAIPAVRLTRLLRRLRQRHWSYRRLAPLLAPLGLFLAFDAAGEFIGYTVGVGGAKHYVDDIDFCRERFMIPSDARDYGRAPPDQALPQSCTRTADVRVTDESSILFSVIIPTYNRPTQLRECLGALASLDYPSQKFEVIVVDDGGDQDLTAVIDDMRGQLDLRLVRRVNGGPAAARNSGAQLARGRFLAFTDDDCLPEPGWLTALAHKLEADDRWLVGGRTVNTLSDNAFASTSQLIIDLACAHYNADAGCAFFLPSNNLALSAAAFATVGGFSNAFVTAEDRDLCARWFDRGFPMAVVPEAVVRHAHALDLASFWRQHWGYGRGAWRFLQAERERSGRSSIEIHFYKNVVRELLHHLPAQRQPVKVAGLLALWQAANLGGFVRQALTGT
jgi:GT2 family glycosyltransferase